MSVSNITPYLTIGKTIFVEQSNKCLNKNFPAILIGNAPVDGGHLILTEEEKRSWRNYILNPYSL